METKQLQLAWVTGRITGTQFAVTGTAEDALLRWRLSADCGGKPLLISTVATEAETRFCCSVTEAVSDFRFIAGSVAAACCITVSGLIRRVFQRAGQGFRRNFRAFRLPCQGCFRQERRLRL